MHLKFMEIINKNAHRQNLTLYFDTVVIILGNE